MCVIYFICARQFCYHFHISRGMDLEFSIISPAVLSVSLVLIWSVTARMLYKIYCKEIHHVMVMSVSTNVGIPSSHV